MAEDHHERNSHIPHPENPDENTTNVHLSALEPQLSGSAVPTPQPSQSIPSPFLSPAPPHLHPEPARIVFNSIQFPGAFPSTSRTMGNVVMQSAGNSTGQYVVVIGNIPWKEKWQDLKDLARRITPNVERAEIYTGDDGRSRGMGFVRIKGLEEAQKVLEALDGYEWDGRVLMAIIGNLLYDCPVGGAPGRLGPGQTIRLQHPAYPQEEPFPPLPPEYHDPIAMTHSSPVSGNPMDLELHYHSTYIRAYMHYIAKANFHQRKTDQLLRNMAEARRQGRLDATREYQREFYAHREAGHEAKTQATMAEQLAHERAQRYHQLALAMSGVPPPLPPGNVYPQPFLSVPMVEYGNSNNPKQPIFPRAIERGAPRHSGQDSVIVPATEYIHVAPTPIYVTPPNGLPVNLSHGAVQTECRSVFIGNLPYDITWRELKEFLESSTRVDVHRNADNRAKGHATASFESPEAAEQACLRFNNSIFKGRQIRVRMDRHCTARRLGQSTVRMPSEEVVEDTRTGTRYTPPIVVDGSMSISPRG